MRPKNAQDACRVHPALDNPRHMTLSLRCSRPLRSSRVYFPLPVRDTGLRQALNAMVWVCFQL